MTRSRLGTTVTLVVALALAGLLTQQAHADLLVCQGTGNESGYRLAAEAPLAYSLESAEAALVVLFFPPLTPPPDPPDDPPDPPDDPPDPPDDPPDPPDDPPHHNPEPASLISGVLGSGLICIVGWWRRRR